MADVALRPVEELVVSIEREPELGLVGLIGTRDHKKIGMMIVGTALVLFFAFGALALVMRAQLSQPGLGYVTAKQYAELFTMHGSGMIFMVITPIALGLGVYLVPLQVGAPFIAAPRVTLFGYWMYFFGALTLLCGFLTGNGAGTSGWYAYEPLSSSLYDPGRGMDLWALGAFMSAIGMVLISATVLWTALRLRAPGMTLLRMPVFTWSSIVACMMGVMAFPSLMAAMTLILIGRVDPGLMQGNAWAIGYQNIFWFYGHPVVYIMFFPYVGCVAEVLACFSGRKYEGYKFTVFALLSFAGLSMAVWGHHMLTTGEVTNDYYSFTSIMLSVPAGVEYFGFLGTLLGGRIRFTTPMLFAIAFIPNFLIGGLTGIMTGTPVVDYMAHGTYFVVAHFHYTLFAGSVFGLFAGLYFWWPKATGWKLGERLGKVHFTIMLIGTHTTFFPMAIMAFYGMSRRQATYPSSTPLDTLNAISSVGAALIGISMLVFALNVILSFHKRRQLASDPWGGGQALEWSTSCPPPRFNYYTLPPIKSYAPLQTIREEVQEQRGEVR